MNDYSCEQFESFIKSNNEIELFFSASLEVGFVIISLCPPPQVFFLFIMFISPYCIQDKYCTWFFPTFLCLSVDHGDKVKFLVQKVLRCHWNRTLFCEFLIFSLMSNSSFFFVVSYLLVLKRKVLVRFSFHYKLNIPSISLEEIRRLVYCKYPTC